MPSDQKEPVIGEEIRRMHAEPLLKAEKVMIVGSLALGVVLLAGFLLLTWWMPGTH